MSAQAGNEDKRCIKRSHPTVFIYFIKCLCWQTGHTTPQYDSQYWPIIRKCSFRNGGIKEPVAKARLEGWRTARYSKNVLDPHEYEAISLSKMQLKYKVKGLFIHITVIMENFIFIKENMFGITSVFTNQLNLIWPDSIKILVLHFTYVTKLHGDFSRNQIT